MTSMTLTLKHNHIKRKKNNSRPQKGYFFVVLKGKNNAVRPRFLCAKSWTFGHDLGVYMQCFWHFVTDIKEIRRKKFM